MNGIHIGDVETRWSLESEKKIGNVEIDVCVETGPEDENGRPGFLWARIEDADGVEVDAIFPMIPENNMSFCMRVTEPELWNAEVPRVYTVIVEIRDEQEEILECRRSVVAFYQWEIIDGDSCLNGKKIAFRTLRYRKEEILPDGLTSYLKQMKREFLNSLLIRREYVTATLEELCLLYGIYLIVEGEHVESGRLLAILERGEGEKRYEKNPDFGISVVKGAALIENRSVFANTSQYQLVFEVRRNDELIQKGKIHADIPAGESKYLDLPMMELRSAGTYRYCVCLCLEAGQSWEEEGYVIAQGEACITNLYEL